ncbi:hypothetical protein [Nocardia cyriacigeorgica]|uniref:hypothetical protein n=1 Tax=Nocardia cyriacigeorgica TaxID=135487 RepID=UPI00245549EE|nr:hypothetical protein [Nocardia cyriacigeorgica]
MAIEPDVAGVARTFHDCLLVHLYVEPGERDASGDVVRSVRLLMAQTGAAYVVISGSPVLPDGADRSAMDGPEMLAYLADTLDLVEEIGERLEERGERVHLLPFGWSLYCGRACSFARPCEVAPELNPARRRPLASPTPIGVSVARPSGWATTRLMPPRRQPIGPSTRSR